MGQSGSAEGPTPQPSGAASNPYNSNSNSGGIFAQTPSSVNYTNYQQGSTAAPGAQAGFGVGGAGAADAPASLAASHMLSGSFAPNTAQEEARAADLLADFSLDFGFPPTEQNAPPLDAYSNLLDDTTLNFWAALSNNQAD